MDLHRSRIKAVMPYLPKLILRNALRHKLRTALTVLGVVVAVVAFGLLRTFVDAWYAGAEATSATRLITRNAVSLVFPLPISYRNRILQVPGVESVTYANWFGGVYIDEKNFFPQFAIDPKTYLELYPEYGLSSKERAAFLRDRKGCVAGRKVAEEHGWKVGDVIPLRGTIYPGEWSFVLRGIYRGADRKTDETQLFFHWDNLNEQLKEISHGRAEHVGIYVVGISNPREAAEVSSAIDAVFKNSLAETLTETEKAFQLSFVSMTEAILTAIEVVSFVVIIIILAVMANTMAMTARERGAEYATLKAMGFGARFLCLLIVGESLMISLVGGIIGVLLTYPLAEIVAQQLGTLIPVFNVADKTAFTAFGAMLGVGLAAAAIPAWRASATTIAQGLRTIG